MLFRSSANMPSRQTRGWAFGFEFSLKMFLKYSLLADSTSLCADTCFWSSLTNVTSWRYASFLNNPNDLEALLWKSFHLRQNFSDILKSSLQLFFEIWSKTIQIVLYMMENLQPKRNKLQSTLSNRIKTVSSIANIHCTFCNN